MDVAVREACAAVTGLGDELGSAYELAFEEWHDSEDFDLWEDTVGDGVTDNDR
ncbi:MAG TPA: hypothetical protein GXZ60_03030 [Intrasporangiaceae bacterium]|nr:hypothetical protein [Intrasporangiaceae bacterium]